MEATNKRGVIYMISRHSKFIRKFLSTLIPFVIGMVIVYLIDLPKDGFFIKNVKSSIPMIFITNFMLCLIILYSRQIIANIVYCYNLFFMGMVVYIMLFIANSQIYYHAPFEIFTFVYTYAYAREKDKRKQTVIVFVLILISALIEGSI